MAITRENHYKGKLVSFTFTASFGRNEQGKQIRRYKNWTPPKGMTPSKASKEAKKQAEIWETALREEAVRGPPPDEQVTVVIRTPDERSTDEGKARTERRREDGGCSVDEALKNASERKMQLALVNCAFG